MKYNPVHSYDLQRQQLEADVPRLEGAVAAARSEHTRVSELNAAEGAALRSQMASELSAMLKEFILIQVRMAGVAANNELYLCPDK